MNRVKVFTRHPVAEIYPNSLANSIHIALLNDDNEEEILNQEYGILFKKAVVREDSTLQEMGCIEPLLAMEGNEYLIAAKVVDAAGSTTAENRETSYGYVSWRTHDFITFSEEERMNELETVSWKTECEIPDEVALRMRNRWIPLQAIATQAPTGFCLKHLEDLGNIKIPVRYTDGSVHEKKADWDLEQAALVPETADIYRVTGQMEATETGFPLTVGYADPVVYRREGIWYYLATNDNLDDIGLYLRCADSIDGLFGPDAREVCILDYQEEKGFCQTFWAPEFHEIGGNLYILFAVSDTSWGPQCHMMRLKDKGDLMNPSDWEEPVRVCRADGQPLTTTGITLDMTYFTAKDTSYLCWSYRYGIGTPADTGSMLYLATCDPSCPEKLTSEPVLLSRPLYGWENNSGTINNEGPYVLKNNGTIYLAYSGGAACGYSYVIGYLIAPEDTDLLNPGNWKKTPCPVFHSQSVPGIQGPGHNSFFITEDGDVMMAYHAQEREKYFKRCSAIHRVHFAKDGFPMLNVVGERDLPEHLREVSILVQLKQDTLM